MPASTRDLIKSLTKELTESQHRIAELTAKLQQSANVAQELCWEIEKLPAGEQQTKVSVMASDLFNDLKNAA